MAKAKSIIANVGPVSIEAAEQPTDGGKPQPAKFNVLAYTGGILEGAMRNGDQREDVILDLAGMKTGKSLVANLDHQPSQRVGNVNAIGNDGKELNLAGIASAATSARNEVIASAADGFVWQASIEANPTKVEQVKPGATVTVNGQNFTAPAKGGRPLYVARESTLKGFAFVSHGADDNTTVSIAATAASTKETNMNAEVKAWAEGMGIDVDNATPELIATIEENYKGKNGAKPAKIVASNPFEERKIEAKRRADIREIADKYVSKNPHDMEYIDACEKAFDHAIDAGMSVQDFRMEMAESMVPLAGTVTPSLRTRDNRVTADVLAAAICQAGRLDNLDKQFDARTLQTAKDLYKERIGLRQVFLEAAEVNGYRHRGFDVTEDVLRAAFVKQGSGSGHREIHAAAWSALDIANTLAATANKFIFRGWNMVDQTCLRIAKIQNVRDFKTATTVTLTDSLIYEKVGTGGQIRHGTLADTTYTVKAETYAKMLAVTRQDIINDDLGALTDVPTKLGNGAIKILNDIFWTKFLGLVGASFFASGNNNINTGVADMTVGGLDATEVIFRNQTNPDGTPLGLTPSIILVPTALYNKALTLMGSQGAAYVAAYATASGDKNPFFGRYRVETSPYISNSSYTGNTSTAWWMLANPDELPVITIAALNGNVMPTVDTAQAAFNVLGIEMRGYSDVGVNSTEYRGGVHADGGSS
jgi:hypothetical protein